MFQSIKAGVAIVVMTGGVLAAPAFGDTGRNFTINNTNSTVSVQRVWTARAGEAGDPWHEVTLKYAIKPKTDSNFTFPDGDVCLFDIKIQFSDEVTQTFANVNICRGQTITAT